MTVVNLFAGPGAGKSTIAAHLFALLKWEGINAEIVTEFAKDKVWENSLDVLNNQIYVLGKQHHRLFRLQSAVDITVTDSPLLLACLYGKDWGTPFVDTVIDLHHKFGNINIFIDRTKNYSPIGRLQTEDEARIIDKEILTFLDDRDISYMRFPGSRDAITAIYSYVRHEHEKGTI